MQLTVTTHDGRTAVASQTVNVKRPHPRRRDHAICDAECGQLGSDPAHRREHHQQTVRRDRRRPTVPERSRGLQQFGSLTQFVPMNPKNGTTEFAFSYTFTADDARVGKVTFKAVANILGARDALPADNEAIAAPTNVSR